MSNGTIVADGGQGPERVRDDLAPTLVLVRTHLYLCVPKINLGKDGWWSVELPRPSSAAYQFSLHGGWGGERQISAQPVGIKSVNPKGFWYAAFELADFRGNASKLEQVFHERVKALMSCPTRIVESKGIVLLGYRCDYQTQAGWQRLGGLVLRPGLWNPFSWEEARFYITAGREL